MEKKKSNPRKIKENVAMNGNDRIGDVGQSRMRWRIKQTTTVQEKVNAYTHFPEQSESTQELLDTPACGVVRKRENNSPPQVVKKFKTNIGESIQVNSSNGSNVDKKAIDERWKANEERWKTAGYENWLIWTTYSEKRDVERKIEKANKNSLTNSNNQAPNNTNIWNVDKGEIEYTNSQ